MEQPPTEPQEPPVEQPPTEPQEPPVEQPPTEPQLLLPQEQVLCVEQPQPAA